MSTAVSPARAGNGIAPAATGEDTSVAAGSLRRSLTEVLRDAVASGAPVAVTGPRGAGKTTLVREVCARFDYVSLADPDTRAFANQDPLGFLDTYSHPLVVDEAHHATELLPALAAELARAPGRGVVLVSSRHLSAFALPGLRTFELLPLTLRELAGQPDRRLPWESGASDVEDPVPLDWAQVLRGFFPEPALDAGRPSRWYSSYFEVLLDRDVRSLRLVSDLNLFQTFVKTLAAASARPLCATQLGREVGISSSTVRTWLSILEAAYVIAPLAPHSLKTHFQRPAPAPKIHFLDTGLLAFLLGLRDPDHARRGPAAAALFETLVVGEVRKTLAHRGVAASLSYWSGGGHEVDLLVTGPNGQHAAIDTRAFATPRDPMAESLLALAQAIPGAATCLVHTGTVHRATGPARAIPVGAL